MESKWVILFSCWNFSHLFELNGDIGDVCCCCGWVAIRQSVHRTLAGAINIYIPSSQMPERDPSAKLSFRRGCETMYSIVWVHRKRKTIKTLGVPALRMGLNHCCWIHCSHWGVCGKCMEWCENSGNCLIGKRVCLMPFMWITINSCNRETQCCGMKNILFSRLPAWVPAIIPHSFNKTTAIHSSFLSSHSSNMCQAYSIFSLPHHSSIRCTNE